METQNTATTNKDQILKAFQQLLAERKQVAPKMPTKQEAARRAEDRSVVAKALTYTVESIVKGLANLQLNFGKAVDGLDGQLAAETPKLEELRRALRVEAQHLEELRHIRIAADALEILIQEYQETTQAFEAKAQPERQTLDREIAEKTQAWQKEQQEFETALKERQTLLKKERAQDETDYQYELERQRKIEADAYAARKAALERRIAEEDAKREANWAERENILTEQQDALEKSTTLAAAFPQELEEAVRKAREDAIREVSEDAGVQAELFAKEVAANKEVYELQIAALQDAITQQRQQLEHLAAQLQTALTQAQDLAVKAVDGTGKSGKLRNAEE